MLLIRHKKHNREKEILGVASITQHGLASNEYNLPYYESHSDNSNTLALIEYFETNSESEQGSRYITTNSISDIFESVDNGDRFVTTPKFVLIEGAPGMGKTTLCKEIAYRWAKKSLLNDAKLVLLIYLRDPAIMKINNLTELIHYFYNNGNEAKEWSKQYAQMLTKDSSHVVVILDGYDETDSSKQPLINKIFNRQILPKCRIVVTSRLTASDILHSKADVKVEVLGFTDGSKVEYIKQELRGCPDEIQKLQTYLDSHPSIKSICYMPIMMTILMYIFKMKRELPTDSIELYDKFIALAISCHLQKQCSSTNLFTSLQNLPDDCEMFLNDLSKFAFLTLQSDQKIFDDKDIERLFPALANTSLEHLGLINSVQYFCVDKGSNHVFNFLHLSIHEYLAAYYINSIDPCSQFNELEATFLTESYKETWKQVIALNRNSCLIFQNYFIYCKDTHHREIISSWITDCKSSSLFDSFIELCYVMVTTSTISTERVQLLLRNNKSLFQLQVYFSIGCAEFGQSELYIFESDLVINWQELGYEFVKGRNLAFVCIQNVNLLGFKANEQQLMKCFRSQISFSRISLEDCYISNKITDAMKVHLKTSQHFQHFELINCTFETSGFIKLADILSSITTMTHIKIYNSILTNEDTDALASVILSNANLQILNLRQNHFEDYMTKMIESMQQNTKIRIMILSDSEMILSNSKKLPELFEIENDIILINQQEFGYKFMKDEGITLYYTRNVDLLCFKTNEHQFVRCFIMQLLFSRLSLRHCYITNKTIDAMMLHFKSNQCIQSFELINCTFEPNGFIKLADILNGIKTLKHIKITNSILTNEDADALSSVILCNTNLQTVDLWKNHLDEDQIAKVIKSIQQNTALTHIAINVDVTPSGICLNTSQMIMNLSHKILKLSILQSLCNLSSSKVLIVNNAHITQDACKELASVIMHNTRLEELYLDSSNLGIGIVKIAKSLQNITKLRVLSLDNNNIPQEASEELALAIKSNEQLEKLWLNDNDLHSSAIVILNSLNTITTLTMLDLNNNQMPQEAGEALASVIMHNTGLEEVYLHDNNLGIGTLKVAKSLQHITTLKMLSLASNNIPQEASEELALAVKSNEQLEKLWLNENNLHSSAIAILNSLATITTMTMLDLGNNQIPQEAGEALASVIMHNTGLEELYLYSNNLGIGILKVAKSLQHITTLKMLSLASNKIPQEASEELALAIKSNEQLEKLWLNENNLHSSAIAILNSLATITTITILDLGNNQIPQEAGEALASVIMHNTGLEELYLNSNNLGIGTVKVAKSLQHITTLKTLSLTSNKIPQEASEELGLAIESNRLLKKFWLSSNNLHYLVNVILNSLATISTLTVLDLSNNQIPQEAGEAIASVIMHNTRLEELYLHSNNLGIGTVKVAKSLQHITTLKMLSLTSNKIPQEASEELGLAIESNQLLKKFWLSSNNLHYSANVILNSLATISTLTVLDLSNNQIPQEAGEAIASVITHNTRLEELYLHSNNLGIGTMKVAKSLQHITTLRMLSLNNNNIPHEACNEVALAIKSNSFFKGLYLNNNCLHSSLVIILQALQCFSNLNIISLYGNTVTEEAGNLLVSVITRNTELKELRLNLLIAPLKVTEALQSLSCLQKLVFCTCKMSEQIEIILASVITENKSLTWLTLPNIKLSQSVTLQAIATLSNLTTLWLEDNLLSEQMSDDLSLAISSNKSLETLILLDNMLQTGLIEIVKTCNKLSYMKVLQLAHNCIVHCKVVELTSIITQNTSLERILLGGITLNAAECFRFNINEVLHKLHMSRYCSNLISSNDHCASLEVIYIEALRKQIDNSRKCLSDVSIYVYAKNFSFVQKIYHYFGHKSITQFKIQEMKMKLAQVDAKKMISSLCILKKVKVIDLENNNVDEDASFELATALHSNNVLEQLWLRGNKLNTAGALYILNSLEYLTTLQVLDLSYNNIGSESADGIAAVIDNNPLMNQLWLDGNDLYSTGTIVICNALKKIRTLSILSLCNNGITDDAADELSAVITHNVLLEDLLLSNNQLQYTGITIIAESLSKLIKLRKLDLFNNNISRQGTSSLAVVLKNSTSLQDLFLSGNNLETSGALEMCNALSHINSLHVLTLSNNNISDEVTSQLMEVLNNNHLYALLIGGNGLECGALKIAQVIENDNIAMQLLDFSNNNISEQDKEKIKVVFSKRENFQFYV